MARRVPNSEWLFGDVSLLLFDAWEHGARHAFLRPEGDGLEIRFLASDGTEHSQKLSLPYAETVRRLRQMTHRFGRVHVNMGGHCWHVERIASRPRDHGVFLHMRADE